MGPSVRAWLRRHHDPRGPHDDVRRAIALLYDVDHGPGLCTLLRTHRQRLVHVRVERVALRLDRLDARTRERALELAVHEPDALDERVALALGRDAQRPLEVVDDRQDLANQADARAVARVRRVL